MGAFLWVLLTVFVIHLSVGFHFAQGEYVKDAVFVARTKISPEGHILYDHVGLDVAGSWDKGGFKYYAKRDGIYWLALSIGSSYDVLAYGSVMRKSSKFCSVYTYISGIAFGGHDTVGRDFMVPLTPLDDVVGSNTGGFSNFKLYSDNGYQTSLSLFRLTGLMNSSILFSVWTDKAYSGANGPILPFTDITVNEGNGFDLSRHHFRVPKDGLYFVSYSVGTTPSWGYNVKTELRRNSRFLSTLASHSSEYRIHTISRSGLYYLAKDDVVEVWISEDSRSVGNFADGTKLTSFSGFLYEPYHGKMNAWSVARTTSWQSSTPLSPVPFDTVLVNEGGGWDIKKHAYVCPVTGVYYVTLTAGVPPAQPVVLYIIAGGKRQADLDRTLLGHGGIDMMSRSIILHLTSGTTVYLSAEGKTAIYSTQKQETTFTGLLLFPHP